MTDDDHRRWLSDDPLVLNAFLALAATSFAVALTSCLWHHIRTSLHQHPDDPPSILSAALASFHFSVAHSVPLTAQQQSLSVSVSTVEEKDRKSVRSKERRRRGKDPFRDLFKGGKKSKALLKAVKIADHDHSPLSADTLSISSTPQNDTASSTSRSQSPASEILDMDFVAPRLGAESDDGSGRSMTPNGNSSSASEAVTSAVDISDNGSPDATSQTGSICTSLPPDSMTTTDAEVNITSASTAITHASGDTTSSPPSPTACADVRTPQSHNSQTTYTSGSCANLVRARTKLRLSRMDPSVKSSLLLSSTSAPLPDSVASPSNSVPPCPSSSLVPSTYSIDGAGPSTPTNSRGSTPPRSPRFPDQRERNAQPLDQHTAATHVQLASMRTALEASRLREEQLRVEAEQATKERDELRWGWNEDASAWRRRETELQAHIHHLTQQLQAYAAVASYQVQQAPSAFSPPTSPHAHASPRLQHHHPLVAFPLPPPIQTQNSASAPAHVQALLASAPMLPGFTAPSGGLYSGAGFGMLWPGIGSCAPNRDARHGGRLTPESSASGSSSRGRWQPGCAENATSVSDESSLGDWDGVEDCSGDEDTDTWEEEDDVFRNNALADAILKRPESIRGLSRARKRSGVRPPMHWGGVGERLDSLKDPSLEKPMFAAPLADIPAFGQ